MNRQEYNEKLHAAKETLAHSAGHKYIQRTWKNGKWVYDYGDIYDKEKDPTYQNNRAADSFNKSVEAQKETAKSLNTNDDAVRKLFEMELKNPKAAVIASNQLRGRNRQIDDERLDIARKEAKRELKKLGGTQKEIDKQSQSRDPQADRWLTKEAKEKQSQADAAAKSMNNKLADMQTGQKAQADKAHADAYAKNAAAGQANDKANATKEMAKNPNIQKQLQETYEKNKAAGENAKYQERVKGDNETLPYVERDGNALNAKLKADGKTFESYRANRHIGNNTSKAILNSANEKEMHDAIVKDLSDLDSTNLFPNVIFADMNFYGGRIKNSDDLIKAISSKNSTARTMKDAVASVADILMSYRNQNPKAEQNYEKIYEQSVKIVAKAVGDIYKKYNNKKTQP